jgi:hypothetical protein
LVYSETGFEKDAKLLPAGRSFRSINVHWTFTPLVAEAIGEGGPLVAEAIGEGGPLVAEAFAKEFLWSQKT